MLRTIEVSRPSQAAWGPYANRDTRLYLPALRQNYKLA